MKNISAGISNVIQGEQGLSAYQVAVKNGFSGTEAEWLNSLKPDDTLVSAAMDVATAQAQVSAQQAAVAAQQAQNAAASANNAMQYRLDAERYAVESATKANAAQGYAGSAATAAGTASSDAAYISAQISAALAAASIAGAAQRNAAVSQEEAYQSEIRAARSAELAAERTTGVSAAYLEAVASISAGTARVQNAVASAEAAADRAANTVRDINADASVMSGYATEARQSANRANVAADRAETAAQQLTAIVGDGSGIDFSNYYNKTEVDAQHGNITASIAAVNSSVTAVRGDVANIVSDSISAFNSSLNSFSVSLGDSIRGMDSSFGGSIRALDSDFGDSIRSLRADVATIVDEKVIPATAASLGLVKLYDEPGENLDGTMTQKAIKQGIDSVQNALFDHVQQAEAKLVGVYTPRGNVPNYAALPTVGNTAGEVYNILTSDSVNGVLAGDNVVWVDQKSHHEEGVESAVGKYNPQKTYYTDSEATTEIDVNATTVGYVEADERFVTGTTYYTDTNGTILDTTTQGTRYVQATGTYVDGTTYYTDNTGATTVDTTGFTAGETDVSSYFVAEQYPLFVAGETDMSSYYKQGLVPVFVAGVTPMNAYYVRYSRDVVDQEAGWDKLSGTFVLAPASSVKLGGVKIGDNLNVSAEGLLSVPTASSVVSGTTKIYAEGGNNTDGTINQAQLTASIAALASSVAAVDTTAWTTNNLWIE